MMSALIVCTAAQESAPPAEPIVQLPPMIISDTAGSARWLYAKLGEDEYLSRCSASLTRRFIVEREQSRHRLRAIVPDAFLANLPTLTLLHDQDADIKAGDQVGRELLGKDKPASGTTEPARPVRFLPNLRLDDRDLSIAFAFLDEEKFRQTELITSSNNLRFLLERRTPMLPPWLVEGLVALNATVDVRADPVTLRPFVWLSRDESAAIARNPARPRALLPASELFAADALRGEGNHHPLRVQTLRTQVGLFVRWALDPRNQAREAFWKFAQQASEERVTEELFIKHFGFGYSDLRDRLSDYLPLALKDPLQLSPGAPLKTPTFEIREATPFEQARLRGAWERLEISYVQRSHPDFVKSYIVQARRTLRRTYEQGDNDPRLLTEIGLCEIDAGTPAEALPFLEKAVTAGVNRPRAYVEVARLRFAELMRGQAANRILSAAEIAPVIEPLRQAIKLTPPLPEAYGLLADAWVRSRDAAPAQDIEAFVRAARSFAMNPAVSYRLALALARYGRRAEAAELLATGIEYVPDEAARARYAQLQTAVAGAGAAKK